jgi:diguanylate cyclase
MRYSESKEKSSELLRLALPLMAQQQAALHPVSYCLWYEHVAGLNAPLSEALAQRLRERRPLTEDDVYALHSRHIVARDMENLERLQQKLRTLLEEAVQAMAAASDGTGQFGVTLEQTRSQLSGPLAFERVQSVIGELVAETARMQAATRSASERLEANVQQVGVLTEQLERAQSEALLDPLTGLKNRRGLERAVQEITGRLDEGALLVIDVDHFKVINDTHGHLLGDRVLRAIGQILQANIKGRDIAARLGGEEFAVLLLGTSSQGAQVLAEQIRLAVARGRIRRIDGTELVGAITVSIGIASARAGEDFDALLARTDAALYRAKRDGRNLVRLAE